MQYSKMLKRVCFNFIHTLVTELCTFIAFLVKLHATFTCYESILVHVLCASLSNTIVALLSFSEELCSL